MSCRTQKAWMDIASACGSTLFGLRLYFGLSPVGSGGPRIGGVGVGPVEVGSLWFAGSTAPGSALGGTRLRFGASGVWTGFLPVTSPRAIAVTPLKPDRGRYGGRGISHYANCANCAICADCASSDGKDSVFASAKRAQILISLGNWQAPVFEFFVEGLDDQGCPNMLPCAARPPLLGELSD